VDDFSLRKGQVFGTILVDLERHQPIELLPDRSSDTLADWLQTHPGVEIISRDRSAEYADGATRGAPDAVQVADRFHLLQNLREALQRVLEQHLEVIQVAQMPPSEPAPLPSVEPFAPLAQCADDSLSTATTIQSPPAAPRTRQERLQAERRARRQERYTQVRELHAQGASIHAIARQIGLSRQTVRRFLRASQFPEQGQRRPRRRKLDPFVPYLCEQLAAGNDNGAALWRELRDQQGYSGSRSQVTQWVARHRYLCPSSSDIVRARRGRPPATEASMPPAPRRRSARQVSWLLIRPFDDLEAEEQQLLERLTRACCDIQVAYTLGQAFITMVKTHDHAAYDQWIVDVRQSGVGELESFAVGLERDSAAVRAALRLPYSNGQVEGQVNRLKLIKRMAYGRASFELLRQRVLAA
jgi:transposase